MSCICQFFVDSAKDGFSQIKDEREIHEINEKNAEAKTTAVVPTNAIGCSISEISSVHSISTSEVSASDLAASKTEIWLLKKDLADARLSIESLENLVKMMIQKQNQLMTEMFELKRTNFEIQTECQTQRDYQTLERNTMLREMQEIKILLGDRTQLLERTMQQNFDLTNALQDASEKIYSMGTKYLKLKQTQSSLPESTPTVSSHESESDCESIESYSSKESLQD